MKELNMMCVGDTISFNNFLSIFSAAGTNTNISLTMPQALPQLELQNLLMSAGSKKLSLQISGLSANTAQLIALLSAAVAALPPRLTLVPLTACLFLRFHKLPPCWLARKGLFQ